MQKQITIRGRSYSLRADAGDDVENAAAEVDRRMRELSGRSAAVDDYTVALLTALNLASELQALRRRVRERLDSIDRQAAAVEALVEGQQGQADRPEDSSWTP